MYRLHPSWVAARELLRRGRIGGSWRPELVLLLQRRPGQHPQHRRGRRRRADTTSAATASTCRACSSRRADPRAAIDRARPGRGHRHRPAPSSSSRTGSRPSPARRARGRSARRRLRHDGADLDRDPVQHPARSADPVFVTAGGDPPVNPDTETLTFEGRSLHREAEPSRAPCSTAGRCPCPPTDAVANLRVIEPSSLAAAEGSGVARPRSSGGQRPRVAPALATDLAALDVVGG
jgi:hypothetical protein